MSGWRGRFAKSVGDVRSVGLDCLFLIQGLVQKES